MFTSTVHSRLYVTQGYGLTSVGWRGVGGGTGAPHVFANISELHNIESNNGM